MPIPVIIISAAALAFCYALYRDKLWLGITSVSCALVTGVLGLLA